MLESDILHTAVENLERLAKVKVSLGEVAPKNGHAWDAQLEIRAGAASGQFKVEVKKNGHPAALVGLLDKLTEANGLLVARQISGPGRELLETRGINYLDMAGNCLIRSEGGIFLQIKGESLPAEFKEVKHKAFNNNGIKLIYALLLQPELVNAPYRSMAEAANISSSTVGNLLEDLKASKFLYQQNESTKVLPNLPELLAQWVRAYHQKLKPKLFRGKYRFIQTQSNWRDRALHGHSYWGGEPAADLLTNYLSPGVWTIYSNDDRKMLTGYGLVPDPHQGKVEVYSPFWKGTEAPFVMDGMQTVSPLLVYADLMGTGNDRNIETAKRIYEQYLKNNIERSDG